MCQQNYETVSDVFSCTLYFLSPNELLCIILWVLNICACMMPHPKSSTLLVRSCGVVQKIRPKRWITPAIEASTDFTKMKTQQISRWKFNAQKFVVRIETYMANVNIFLTLSQLYRFRLFSFLISFVSPFCQEYPILEKAPPLPWKLKFGQDLALWVLTAKNLPPPRKIEIWPELGTLSFDYPRIAPPPHL